MIDKNKYTELDDHLPYQIDYTANFNKSFRREFQTKFVSDEITADELVIFYAIYYDPKISQSELAKFLFKGKAHVGKILNDMESRGLIKRTADTRDNIIIKRNDITPKGMKIFEKGYPLRCCGLPASMLIDAGTVAAITGSYQRTATTVTFHASAALTSAAAIRLFLSRIFALPWIFSLFGV